MHSNWEGPSLEIFVIFHRKIYPAMYKELEPDELECLRFVAVNENTQTRENDETPNGTPLIKEWELPVYNSKWQEQNWMNGGVNHHLMLNKIPIAEYIGFVQYDMNFPKGSIRKLKEMLKPTIGVSIKTMDFLHLIGSSTYGFHEFDLYNYAVSQLNPIRSRNFPLFHNCFMLREHYEKIMPSVLKIDETLFQFHNKPGDPPYRFPITTERTLALAIGTVVNDVLEFKDISHERIND